MTPLLELQERAELLTRISQLERSASWIDLDELRERYRLLTAIEEQT